MSAYTIPTDAPEADGTFEWGSTTLLLVELEAGRSKGLGYTYTHAAAVVLARDLLGNHVLGADPTRTNELLAAMRKAQRNYGREGLAAAALSAIDMALWDLKACLFNVPLCMLLGQVREGAPVYGSGGFTSYSDQQLSAQLNHWVAEGIPRVKMKIGTHPEQDLHRVKVARRAIGYASELFVDANGAYSRKQALRFAEQFAAEMNVTWFEEPVSSDDLEGLRLLRDRAPAGMDIAAGEYGWTASYLQTMMNAGAVDVIQADATRCGGVTGFMEVAAIADAHPLPLSAHCGPSAHLHLACAARPLRHVEYFHHHARIESMLFDGFRAPQNGVMVPDLSRPGMGLEFKHADAERYKQ